MTMFDETRFDATRDAILAIPEEDWTDAMLAEHLVALICAAEGIVPGDWDPDWNWRRWAVAIVGNLIAEHCPTVTLRASEYDRLLRAAEGKEA